MENCEERQTVPIERILRPFQQFTKLEVSGSLLLIACTVVALIWANSPWYESYHHLWEHKLSFQLAQINITMSLHEWINDALMAIFFFVVGLEIKREFLVGDLSSPKQAAVPIAAALGGMIVPALIYTFFNHDQSTAHGWGIPMATDIAFALGALTLLGKRVPLSLKVFLTALAIVDDLGAVLVIAFFYTEQLASNMLVIGGSFFLLLLIMNRLGVRNYFIYMILSFGLWLCFLQSGVHATIAGVVAALSIPASSRINSKQFLEDSKIALAKFETAGTDGTILTNTMHQSALHTLETRSAQLQAPLLKLEHDLQPLVTYLIMPLFALSNAGVHLNTDISTSLTSHVGLGVILGLVLGKPIGISLFSFLAIKLKMGVLPKNCNKWHIMGASCLGGIGFTMSLFVANLAFKEAANIDIAKISILSASALASIIGLLLLMLKTKKAQIPLDS